MCAFIPARIKFQRKKNSFLIYFGKLILLSSKNLREKKNKTKKIKKL
jgi:hypothetical protein